MKEPFYVYALKDPRTSPAQPFYVGKGIGTRAWDHLLKPDATEKGRRIREILRDGAEVQVTVVCDDLNELQALRIEAELIASFGTLFNGGILTNTVVPSGLRKPISNSVIVPLGAPEKAQLGVSLLKSAVLELTQVNDRGITNSEVCHALGLHSDYKGGSKDYLSWSILGLLMREGRVQRKDRKSTSGKSRGYHVATVR